VRRALPLVLFAAACATPRASRQDPDALACGRGDSAACARRGLTALGGDGVPRDEREAAAWLMAACERGHGQSCADLGALYAAGRGVRQDDGRACELGLADACARAGRPPPDMARTPRVKLPPETEPERSIPPDEGDLQRALHYAEFYVPARDHKPLGLTREALEADPPAPMSDVQLVQPPLDARATRVASCLPVYRYPDGREYPSHGVLSFALGRDGRVSRVIVKLGESSESVQRCVREGVTGWEFPRPATGGRMWFRLTGTGPVANAPASPRPGDDIQYPKPGWRWPREKEPGCIASSVRLPRGFEGVTGHFTVQYGVNVDGRASDFLLFQPVPTPIARSIREAVYSCEFVPAADEGGTPRAVWTIQPIRLLGH